MMLKNFWSRVLAKLRPAKPNPLEGKTLAELQDLYNRRMSMALQRLSPEKMRVDLAGPPIKAQTTPLASAGKSGPNTQ